MKENIFKFFDKVILADSLNENVKNIYKTFSKNNKNELIKLLSIGGDYHDAWKNYLDNKGIYRGANNYLNKNDIAVEVTPGIRISTSKIPNVYTILLSDILKSWKKFPKRNKSHICSISRMVAGEYGTVYYVFPRNDAKIGICPTNDIFDSFKNELIDISADSAARKIVIILDVILNDKTDIPSIEMQLNDSLQTIKMFKDFDTAFDKTTSEQRQKLERKFLLSQNLHPLMSYYTKFVEEENSNKSDFLKFIEKYVYSAKNFKCKKVKDLFNFISQCKNNEVWFEGPAIYIPTTSNKLEWLEKNVRTD